jgi:hypothetical protein
MEGLGDAFGGLILLLGIGGGILFFTVYIFIVRDFNFFLNRQEI